MYDEWLLCTNDMILTASSSNPNPIRPISCSCVVVEGGTLEEGDERGRTVKAEAGVDVQATRGRREANFIISNTANCKVPTAMRAHAQKAAQLVAAFVIGERERRPRHFLSDGVTCHFEFSKSGGPWAGVQLVKDRRRILVAKEDTGKSPLATEMELELVQQQPNPNYNLIKSVGRSFTVAAS